MSTRSTIRIRRENGTETGIYCHYDGYVEGVGVALQLAYNTADKVEELLSLGDLSTLGYTPDECRAYHRDYGEGFHQSNGDEEFIYTFDEYDACWYVTTEQFCKTQGMELIGLDSLWVPKKELLIDAIMKTDIDKHWRDDDYAKSGAVVDACIEKALDARRERFEQQRAQYDAYYSAYYN